MLTNIIYMISKWLQKDVCRENMEKKNGREQAAVCWFKYVGKIVTNKQGKKREKESNQNVLCAPIFNEMQNLLIHANNKKINLVRILSAIMTLQLCQRQRVASEKPTPIKPKPTTMFQAPILGIGYWVWET